MATPDIRLLVGAQGGSAPNGASARLIREELQAALDAAGALKVKVQLDTASVKAAQTQAQSAVKSAISTSPVESALDKILDAVQTKLKKSGDSLISSSIDAMIPDLGWPETTGDKWNIVPIRLKKAA